MQLFSESLSKFFISLLFVLPMASHVIADDGIYQKEKLKNAVNNASITYGVDCIGDNGDNISYKSASFFVTDTDSDEPFDKVLEIPNFVKTCSKQMVYNSVPSLLIQFLVGSDAGTEAADFAAIVASSIFGVTNNSSSASGAKYSHKGLEDELKKSTFLAKLFSAYNYLILLLAIFYLFFNTTMKFTKSSKDGSFLKNSKQRMNLAIKLGAAAIILLPVDIFGGFTLAQFILIAIAIFIQFILTVSAVAMYSEIIGMVYPSVDESGSIDAKEIIRPINKDGINLAFTANKSTITDTFPSAINANVCSDLLFYGMVENERIKNAVSPYSDGDIVDGQLHSCMTDAPSGVDFLYDDFSKKVFSCYGKLYSEESFDKLPEHYHPCQLNANDNEIELKSLPENKSAKQLSKFFPMAYGHSRKIANKITLDFCSEKFVGEYGSSFCIKKDEYLKGNIKRLTQVNYLYDEFKSDYISFLDETYEILKPLNIFNEDTDEIEDLIKIDNIIIMDFGWYAIIPLMFLMDQKIKVLKNSEIFNTRLTTISERNSNPSEGIKIDNGSTMTPTALALKITDKKFNNLAFFTQNYRELAQKDDNFFSTSTIFRILHATTALFSEEAAGNIDSLFSWTVALKQRDIDQEQKPCPYSLSSCVTYSFGSFFIISGLLRDYLYTVLSVNVGLRVVNRLADSGGKVISGLDRGSADKKTARAANQAFDNSPWAKVQKFSNLLLTWVINPATIILFTVVFSYMILLIVYITSAIIYYITMIFRSLLIIPIWGLAHITLADDDSFQSVAYGYNLYLSVLLQPVFLLIGIFISFLGMALLTSIGLILVMALYTAFDPAMNSGNFVMDAAYTIGFSIFSILIVGIAIFKSAQLIYKIPKESEKWISVEGSDEEMAGEFIRHIKQFFLQKVAF